MRLLDDTIYHLSVVSLFKKEIRDESIHGVKMAFVKNNNRTTLINTLISCKLRSTKAFNYEITL